MLRVGLLDQVLLLLSILLLLHLLLLMLRVGLLDQVLLLLSILLHSLVIRWFCVNYFLQSCSDVFPVRVTSIHQWSFSRSLHLHTRGEPFTPFSSFHDNLSVQSSDQGAGCVFCYSSSSTDH